MKETVTNKWLAELCIEYNLKPWEMLEYIYHWRRMQEIIDEAHKRELKLKKTHTGS